MPDASAARRREIMMHGCQQQQQTRCVLVRGETATSMRKGVTPPVACMQCQGGAPAAPYCKHATAGSANKCPTLHLQRLHMNTPANKAPSRKIQLTHDTSLTPGVAARLSTNHSPSDKAAHLCAQPLACTTERHQARAGHHKRRPRRAAIKAPPPQTTHTRPTHTTLVSAADPTSGPSSAPQLVGSATLQTETCRAVTRPTGRLCVPGCAAATKQGITASVCAGVMCDVAATRQPDAAACWTRALPGLGTRVGRF